MTTETIRKRYLIHTILHKFTEKLFFTFGILLIFAKTNSIPTTLLFVLFGVVVNLLLKSVGLPIVTGLFRNFGLVSTMSLGLLIKASSLFGIFILQPDLSYFNSILFLLSGTETIGNVLYVVGANALMFQVIGTSKHSGSSTALITILQIASGLVATAVGIVLALNDAFLYTFLVGVIVLLISTIPLLGIKIFTFQDVSFSKNLRKISLGMFFANVNPEHEYKVTAVPLIILMLSASLETSVWISAAVAATSIVLSFITGKLLDRRSIWVIWTAFFVGTFAWVLYGFAVSPIHFLIPGILIGLSAEVLGIGREAKMSKELYADNNIFGGTLAVEFGRASGKLIGLIILLAAYVLYDTLPQLLLITGGLFLIPITLYSTRRF